MAQQGKSGKSKEPVAHLLPLTPAVFHILVTLADGEAHGYAIMQEVNRRSGGIVRLGPGTLYGAISRLLAEGLIEESEARPDPEMDDTRRRYYRLSKLGLAVAREEGLRLDMLVKTAKARGLTLKNKRV